MAVATSTLVALGLAAAAAGTSYYNTKQTNKRIDRETARGITQRAEKQKGADEAVNKLIDKTQLSDPDAARTKATDSYLQTIRANAGAANRGLQQEGAVSNRFRQESNDAALGVVNAAQNTAGQLARIDAPMYQRQQEAVDRGRTAVDIDRIRRFADGDEFLHKLRLQGIRPNANLAALSSFLGGASSAAGAWGGADASAGNNPGSIADLYSGAWGF